MGSGPKSRIPNSEFRIPSGVGIQLELPLSYGFFLRPSQVARIFHVDRTTVYRMIWDGRLQAVNLNEGTNLRPCLRIPRNSLYKKLQESTI